jgi:hypothetical protein
MAQAGFSASDGGVRPPHAAVTHAAVPPQNAAARPEHGGATAQRVRAPGPPRRLVDLVVVMGRAYHQRSGRGARRHHRDPARHRPVSQTGRRSGFSGRDRHGAGHVTATRGVAMTTVTAGIW